MHKQFYEDHFSIMVICAEIGFCLLYTSTLLFRVQVEGDGLVCHEGTVSCFTRPIPTAEVTRG